MLILASRQITFESFGADLLTNLGKFRDVDMELFASSCDATVAAL